MCTRSCARANDAKIVCSRDAQCNTKAPAKRSQHVNTTYRNIVGRNMLRAFGHRVAMCCDMLGVVGSGLKMVKFEPTIPNTSQHVATGWPNARNKFRPTMLRSFGRGLSSRPLLLRISSAHASHWARACHVIFKRALRVKNSTKYRADDLCVNLVCECFLMDAR